MIDEKYLDAIYASALYHLTREELDELIHLARLGLMEGERLIHIENLELQVCRLRTTVEKLRPLAEWAKEHGAGTVRQAETFIESMPLQQDISSRINREACLMNIRAALKALPKEPTDG